MNTLLKEIKEAVESEAIPALEKDAEGALSGLLDIIAKHYASNTLAAPLIALARTELLKEEKVLEGKL